MEKAENARGEQVNVLIPVGEDADLFKEYMSGEAILTKSAAGYQLIVQGLRRWKASRASAQSATDAA